MRLFVAIELPSDVRRALGVLVESSRPHAPRARWADPRTSHVTLLFLGEVDEAALPAVTTAVEAAAGRHGAVRLQFDAAGTFPRGGSRARVLWVGFDAAGSARLVLVHEDLRALLLSAGLAFDDESLSPHVTLARTRDPRGDRMLSALATSIDAKALGAIDAREIVLYQSELHRDGAVHTPLVRAPLSK